MTEHTEMGDAKAVKHAVEEFIATLHGRGLLVSRAAMEAVEKVRAVLTLPDPVAGEKATDVSDLVERLRAHMGKAEIADVLTDCRAAADEIERLRTRCEPCKSEFPKLQQELAEARRQLVKSHAYPLPTHKR